MDDEISAVAEDRMLAEDHVEMMLMQTITLLKFRLCFGANCWGFC